MKEQWQVMEEEPLEFLPVRQKKHKKHRILMFIIYIAIIFVSASLIPEYILQRTIVDGRSMENTLEDGDHLLVEKVSYRFNGLKRFDIVAFYPYGRKDSSDYYLKRIIGLPGETVQIKADKIYINGKELKEHYGKDKITYAGTVNQPVKLSKDEYFVLGDYRSVSMDSRFAQIGLVKKDEIGGRAIFRIWPWERVGIL